MAANFGLKGKIVQTYGTQTVGSRGMRISESRLSRIIQGHIKPSNRERQALENALGRSFVKKTLNSKNEKLAV